VATRRNLAHLAARAGLRLRLTGTDRVPAWGALLVVANHPGAVDATVLVAATPRPLHVLERDVATVAPLRGTLDSMGGVPTTGGEPDLAAARTVLAAFDEFRAVALFPENRVGVGDVADVDDLVGYLLLQRPDVPVLPAAVLGTRTGAAVLQSVPRWRAEVAVVFGDAAVPPPPPADLAPRAAAAWLAEQVRQRLHDHVATSVRRTGISLPDPDPSTQERR
jgi:1-acyl-sn-glycerol-3-phosphate acyltransferase